MKRLDITLQSYDGDGEGSEGGGGADERRNGEATDGGGDGGGPQGGLSENSFVDHFETR